MARAIGREAGPGTQSVERALSLLAEFTEAHPQRRVSELVAATGLGQSTVSRLVAALVALGFLAYDQRSGLYGIGPKVITLAGIGLNEMPVHQQARQVAQNLAADLNLGANVAERHGAEMFYLCHFEGRAAGRSSTLVGRTGPLHATAVGKALISELPRPEWQELLGDDLARYTPHTVTAHAQLEKMLRQVRERGYALEVEELAFGRACLAAPIRDRTGAIVAALSASGPLSAMDLPHREESLAMQVIEQADQISSGLGYHASAAVS